MVPILTIPVAQQQDHDDQEFLQHLTFFSLPDKSPCMLDNGDDDVDVADTLRQGFRCLGSSHGWLAFVHENSDKPFLFDPCSETTICLPSVHSFPGRGRSKIDKLVLCGDPSHEDDYAVVAMNNAWLRSRIAFCRRGDEYWTDLGSNIETCDDIVCCDVTRSVFALGPGPKVEVWDLSRDVPSRKTVIRGSCPSNELARDNEVFPRDLYTARLYLALSGIRQMFLAVRYIGEFVRYDGVVVYEGDKLTEYASEPLVCPYKTVGFRLFNYDHRGDGEWVEVKSLDDCSLFLGLNQSTMVKKTNEEVKGNLIYFTDDYWDRMNGDYSYGGHDMGIFNLEDGSIRPVLESRQRRIVPPPMWIIPHV